MLPTSGYFRGVGCPSHEVGQCNRPYCHFHHSLKTETGRLEPPEEAAVAAVPSRNERESDNSVNRIIPPPVKQLDADNEPPSPSPSPSCSTNTEVPNLLTSNLGKQSDLLQQLVSEAVKKVLMENPQLASAGVDPSAILAQASAGASSVNSTKKKYYPRPPDTPSYNPTPIKELNKRKRSNEYQEDCPGSKPNKATKYVPSAMTTTEVISDVIKSDKDSGESEATDFSSAADDDDTEQQNCDFDILEEVLAEHSKNNKLKVKKKKVKLLGKLQYNISNNDKKVDESFMISDAQTISDQDSNTYDGPKDKTSQSEDVSSGPGSYFLPPSPVFTSSSDGFSVFNSVVYSKCENTEDEVIDKMNNKEESNLPETVDDAIHSGVSGMDFSKKEKSEKKSHDKKTLSTGHLMLPKLVQSVGAPKLSRADLRTWNPQGRSTSKESNSDPLEAILQQMDGSQTPSRKDLDKGSSEMKQAPCTDSPKNSKKYKVDLDKEIESLTSTSVIQDNEDQTADDSGKLIHSDDANKIKKSSTVLTDTVEKKGKEVSQGVASSSTESTKEIKQKPHTGSYGRNSDETSPEKSHDKSNEVSGEEGNKSSGESEVERDSRRKKKRKRDHSSDSDYEDSHHRKKSKKNRKHRKKYKKRRRRRESSDDSSESDEEVEKGEDSENEANREREEKSEDQCKVENGKAKKHKKKRKRSKHRKKSKHKRSRKMRRRDRSQSQSSSDNSSHSTSRHRSRSSSRHTSRSASRHRSRSSSRHRSRSSSRRKSRSSSKQRSRSRGRQRSRSISSHRSNRGQNRRDRKHRSRSISKHRSRSSSEEKGHSSKKRHKSHNPAHEENENWQMKQSTDGTSVSHNTGTTNDSSNRRDLKKADTITIPMPVDPSKIKLEKDIDSSKSVVIVPDLSIVKKEKEDTYFNVTVKMEKQDSQNKEQHIPNDKNVLKNRKYNVDESSSQTQRERKRSADSHSRKDSESDSSGIKNQGDVPVAQLHKERKKSADTHKEKESTCHDRSAKEINPQSSHKREKESEVQEQNKIDAEKSKSESTRNRKSSRQSSTDSRKSDKEHTPAKSVAGERRISADDKHSRSTSATNFQKESKSMFDMVEASMKPPKQKSLKEFSLFDNVCSDGYESSSDSPGISDTDLPDAYNENEKSPDHSHSHLRKTASSKQERELSRSYSKSGGDEHSHLKSKSHKEKETSGKHGHVPPSSSSKHSHSSSITKHKNSSSSHHVHAGSHKSDGNSKHDTTRSSCSSGHTSSSKNQEKKSSSHDKGKDESKHNAKVSHRKSSTSSVDKEKEHVNSHKSKDHKKKGSDKEKEHLKSSRGKETIKDPSGSKGNKTTSRSHKQKESSKASRPEKMKNEKKSSKGDASEDEVSCSSQRELYGSNDDDVEGNNSPFPDLSALDEIPQDDWEQLINSSTDDLKHLENLRSDDEFDIDDFDKEDPDIMEECLQMFHEYKPDPKEVESQVSSKKKVEAKEEPDILPSKHRVARTSGFGNMIVSKSTTSSKMQRKTPAQVMMERYQKMKEERAELLKQLEKQKQQLEEQNRGGVSSSSPSTSKQAAVSSSSVSSTTPSRSKIAPASSTSMKSPHSTSGTSRRVAHTPSVASSSQIREKGKSLTSSSRSASSSVASSASTIAHTVSKGAKRVAHMPKLETLKRPTIQPEFGSKVPPNIRQRYLNSLIDECLKFLGEREAFSLGLAEERVCFLRASSRMVYLNLAVNAVKRLRNQQEAGEAAQELLDTDPMFKDSALLESTSVSEKPSTSRISSSSASNKPKQHPINPNHSRLSHFSVLAVGGNKGSWSIEKPKKNTVDVQNYLKGANFYNVLKKYILNEEQLGENHYPFPDPNEKGKAIVKGIDSRKKQSPSSVERYCDRCSVLYSVDKWGFPLSTGPCVHHWGRPYKRRGYSGWETRYSCCSGDQESEGCCQATTHVSQNYNPNNLRGYVRTLPKDVKDNDYGVYALDCEMSYTTGGCELTRVTVINSEGKTVYEQLVKPDNPIIDYNTRFSGITENDMKDVKITILDVQAALLTRFSDKTILIGHSLESDFHALKLIHDTVVDTSIVFPHRLGPPYKRALKNLASEYLKKIIQNDVSGHDSAEDALTCMHLMQWRVKEDLKGFGQK